MTCLSPLSFLPLLSSPCCCCRFPLFPPDDKKSVTLQEIPFHTLSPSFLPLQYTWDMRPAFAAGESKKRRVEAAPSRPYKERGGGRKSVSQQQHTCHNNSSNIICYNSNNKAVYISRYVAEREEEKSPTYFRSNTRVFRRRRRRRSLLLLSLAFTYTHTRTKDTHSPRMTQHEDHHPLCSVLHFSTVCRRVPCDVEKRGPGRFAHFWYQ